MIITTTNVLHSFWSEVLVRGDILSTRVDETYELKTHSQKSVIYTTILFIFLLYTLRTLFLNNYFQTKKIIVNL